MARGSRRTSETKQENAKNVAEDCSEIVDLNASVRTPYVSSNEALKTEECSFPLTRLFRPCPGARPLDTA